LKEKFLVSTSSPDETDVDDVPEIKFIINFDLEKRLIDGL